MAIKWYAGADHAGVALKDALVVFLRGLGDEVEDLGTHGDTSVDYPDFGAAVGRKVAAEPGSRGLVCCGSGIGISIAANKVAGIRCALIHEAFSAAAARAHNDANVIALGERVIGRGIAEQVVAIFRETPFAGGRHGGRVAKLGALES